MRGDTGVSIQNIFEELIAQFLTIKSDLRQDPSGRYAAIILTDLEKAESLYVHRLKNKIEGKIENGTAKQSG